MSRFISLEQFFKVAISAAPLLLTSTAAMAAPSHGLAVYGEPALPESFEHLPYVNPDAPQGGRIVYGESGRFDSLNPWIVKGRSPWAMRTHVFESMMHRSRDEPFTVYGLLAETVDVSDDLMSATFVLRPEAKFSDGTPVTSSDILFSMETLRDKGRPNFKGYYERVASIETPDARTISFTFKEPERELPLLLGLMPILSEKYWEGKDFAESTIEPPVASGPYVVAAVDTGNSITLKKNPDYWAKDLPITRGIHNFDEVRYIWFRDGAAMWDAFTSGETSQFRDGDPGRWEDGYNFPAIKDGKVIRGELPHSRATGMNGFTFNTRKPMFSDWRVREALTHAFDFESVNETVNRGAFDRITSYYSNSPLGFSGAAEGKERELLEPFEDLLPPRALDEGYTPPVATADGRNRTNLRKARSLLKSAGWTMQDGKLVNAEGEPFVFELLLRSSNDEKIASFFKSNLDRLGIEMDIRLVEGAQYVSRLKNYDFDMIVRRWWLSLSPGAEQDFYFGSRGVTEEGTRNYMGADHPAIDAMIESMLKAEDVETYQASVRALDRVLVAGRYVIPLWYAPTDRFAWWKTVSKPDVTPLYGYRPEVWWAVPESD